MSENARKLFSATATPLASIFGSGFLVIVPILANAVGPYAWLAITGVCVLAILWAARSVSVSATPNLRWRSAMWVNGPGAIEVALVT